jgi:hypothetical protein
MFLKDILPRLAVVNNRLILLVKCFAPINRKRDELDFNQFISFQNYFRRT